MKLLIYIPTYNRATTLMKQLLTLRSFSGDDEVAVVVRDNCSTQAEYIDIKKLCYNHNFSYIRNICNIGANPNILAGFLFCGHADYLWILSDDDLITQNAVAEVFKFLNRYKRCDILYLTHSNVEPEEFEVMDQSQLLSHLNDGLGLISRVIYRSDYIRPHLRAGYDNLMSCFPHLAVLLESVRNEGNISVCRVSKARFFVPEEPQPPSEPIGYVHSLWGFILLTNNLHEKLRKEFCWKWWKHSWYQATDNVSQAPIHSAICFSVLRRYIPLFSIQLLIIKIFLPSCLRNLLVRFPVTKLLYRRLFK